MTTLIGVHGPLNGGKDTVANYLIDKFPGRFRRYAFAKPLKEASKILFGFTDEQIEDRVLKETPDPFWGFAPRKVLQLMGTEFGRNMLREDVWIRRAEMEVTNNAASSFSTIITDVRFQNEADWFRSQSGSILIYLEVPGLVRDAKYNHASEAGITRSDNDFVVVNDKSLGLNNLYHQLSKLPL